MSVAVDLALVFALQLLAAPVRADEPAALRPVAGAPARLLVSPGETLVELAHREHLGFEALVRRNPGVDPWIPVAGTIIDLPTEYVLPPAVEEGLVINIPEMRLYDFTASPLEVYAVAVGDADDPTPIGDFRIGAKRVEPAWNVPESIRKEKPHLPAVVPPGPDNPLGSRWMTIGTSSYGVHGTNLRWSIGRLATHGCVRLYEDDMQRLFDRTPTGTRLQVVYAPYKWGVRAGRILLEVHPDVYGRQPDRLAAALETPRALGLLDALDLGAVMRVVEEQRGAPFVVGTLAPGWAPSPSETAPAQSSRAHEAAPARSSTAREAAPVGTPPARESKPGATSKPTS